MDSHHLLNPDTVSGSEAQARWRLGLIFLTLSAGVALAGCSSGDIAAPPSQELARQLLDSTSVEQRVMLSDLTVSREEYETAHEGFFQCMDSLGWVGEPDLGPDGVLYQLSFFGADPESVAFQTDYRDCEQRFLFDVAQVYRASLVVGDEGSESAKDELMDCLASAGVTGADREWSDSQLADHLDATGASEDAWVCREVALTKLGPER